MPAKPDSEAIVREIKRQIRTKYNAEESIAAISHRYGINSKQYYRWNKVFWEARKKRLLGDTLWVNEQLKQLVAELSPKNPVL